MYPPEMVAPMKADLTEAGFSELITEADVDADTGAVKLSSGKKKHVLLVA